MKFQASREFRLNLYIMVFTVSSFLGWLYETVLTSVRWETFAERGFLQLPICPIYGFGAVILLFLFHRLKSSILLFLASTLVTTGIELAASYLLEYGWHIQLWTYRHWPLNFQGRISFWSSVLFGVLSVLLIKLIYPLVSWWMKKLDGRSRVFMSVLMVGSILMDTMLCIYASVCL
ncbi:MAG: putative ABC transporter permease [Lachnospiraceae bacterium]|nr:putative ABC transporter permease [Lachnospiraceae bacterium]